MSRLKNLITAIVLVAACAVTVAAAVRVARQPLAAEAAAPIDLTEWMVERDLSQETPQKRAQVARRFEKEVGRDSRLLRELKRLDPADRQQMQDNIVQLIEPLFIDKANEYFRQPENRRQRYLDRELDRLTKLIDPVGGDPFKADGFSPASFAAIALFNQHLEQWLADADPAMRPKLREFATALQNRWLARQTERMVDEP